MSLGRPARPLRAASPRPRRRYRRPSRSSRALSRVSAHAQLREGYASATLGFAARLIAEGLGLACAKRSGSAPVVARRWRVRVSAALRSKRCRAALLGATLPSWAALLIICADATRRPAGLLAGCARSSGLPRGGAPAPLPRRYALPPAQKLWLRLQARPRARRALCALAALRSRRASVGAARCIARQSVAPRPRAAAASRALRSLPSKAPLRGRAVKAAARPHCLCALWARPLSRGSPAARRSAYGLPLAFRCGCPHASRPRVPPLRSIARAQSAANQPRSLPCARVRNWVPRCWGLARLAARLRAARPAAFAALLRSAARGLRPCSPRARPAAFAPRAVLASAGRAAPWLASGPLPHPSRELVPPKS